MTTVMIEMSIMRKLVFVILGIEFDVRFLIVERHPAGGVEVAEGLSDSIRCFSVIEGEELLGTSV